MNLANLMLSRAAGRAQEMAVRRSLGAARWRIARQMLTESILLGVVGGVAGMALAFAGFEAIVALLPPNQPRIHIITIDLRVLSIAALDVDRDWRVVRPGAGVAGGHGTLDDAVAERARDRRVTRRRPDTSRAAAV